MYLTDAYLAEIKAAKPNPEKLRAWIAELRSGKYEQITGSLRDTYEGPNCRCVLGVSIDALDPDRWIGNGSYGGSALGKDYEQINEILGCEGEFNPAPLYLANDDYHASFEQFADFLEGAL